VIFYKKISIAFLFKFFTGQTFNLRELEKRKV